MDYLASSVPLTFFRDEYKKRTLVLKPPFQRNFVWTEKNKSALIETMLLGLPIPEIYVQRTVNANGDTFFAVVDGQQRIRTVLQFLGHEIDPDEKDSNDFRLTKLDSSSPYNNKTFADLNDDEKRKLYSYVFAVRYLNTEDDALVREAFRRLNRGLPLKPQELRNAQFRGPFVELATKLADQAYWAENGIVTAASIRRMGDIEFVSELLIGVLHGPQGGSAAVIDEYYSTYEDYEDEFPEQKRVQSQFEKTLEAIQKLFPEIKTTTRWGNKTDFYSVFVAMAAQLRTGTLDTKQVTHVRQQLEALGEAVDKRLANPESKVSKDATKYAKAVEKGANDKARRAERHEVLTRILKNLIKSGA